MVFELYLRSGPADLAQTLKVLSYLHYGHARLHELPYHRLQKKYSRFCDFEVKKYEPRAPNTPNDVLFDNHLRNAFRNELRVLAWSK